MSKRYTTRMNAEGEYEYGYSDDADNWTTISVHETSLEAQDAFKADIAARDAQRRRSTAPPASRPAPLIRLETGDWVDPMEVVGVGIDPSHLAIEIELSTGRTMQVTEALFGDDLTDDANVDRTALAATLAAQINAARVGGGAGNS
jgi:hypothetical protein